MVLWLETPIVSFVSNLGIHAGQREDDSTGDVDDDTGDREEYETDDEDEDEDEEEDEEEEEEEEGQD